MKRIKQFCSLLLAGAILATSLTPMPVSAASWRDALGDEKENKYGRKTIGDFACYLVFMNSICAR